MPEQGKSHFSGMFHGMMHYGGVAALRSGLLCELVSGDPEGDPRPGEAADCVLGSLGALLTEMFLLFDTNVGIDRKNRRAALRRRQR